MSSHHSEATVPVYFMGTVQLITIFVCLCSSVYVGLCEHKMHKLFMSGAVVAAVTHAVRSVC